MKNRLIELCKMTETELFVYMKAMLQSYYGKKVKVNKYEDYIFVQGTDPVCLIAHLDTVFAQPSEIFCYDDKYNILWSPTGLGTDDRAGVLMIILLLERGYRPSIILTTGEELGGAGANVMVTDYKKCPLKNIKYLIELDRAHRKDCVFYSCANKEFRTYVENFGFETDIGSFTDISVFMPQWKIAGVNLSVGYNNEHTYGEYIAIDHFLETLNKVSSMLYAADEAPFFKYVPERIIPFMRAKNCAGCNTLFGKGMPRYCFKDKESQTKYYYCEECANYIRSYMV